jgi:uncharacterized protein YwqG
VAPGIIGDMTAVAPDALHTLARAHLPGEIADRWIGLLRPAAQLRAAGADDRVVGRLGGLPRLPEGMAWPEWEGHGPLSFVAAVDCAALPAGELDLPLPAAGWLAFFYFDGQLDGGEAVVDPGDRATRPGARVLYLPPETGRLPERAAPAVLTPYPEVVLTARVAPSAPDAGSAATHGAFAPAGTPLGVEFAHPVCGEEFTEAVWERQAGVAHQMGGHPQSVQNPVEIEVARGALGGDLEWEDPRIGEEARHWVLLAQFDSDDDADMMWGDSGSLYWLMRPDDLAAGRFDRALFTWQCC